MNSLLGRLGAFTVRRRWYVIGAWVVLLAVMASFASGATGPARVGRVRGARLAVAGRPA